MTDTTPDPQLVREYCDDMAAGTTDAVTVTAVRKALIAESYKLLDQAKDFYNVIEEPVVSLVDVNAYSAMLAASAYSYLLAAVLRRVEASQGVAAASEMAQDGGEQVRGAVASA